MIVVLDTNVLVSALISPFQAPGRILDLLLAGELTIVVDDRILAEYREALLRPKFGFDERSIHEVLVYFAHFGMAVAAPLLNASLPDPDDMIFLEAAAAAGAPLVTGNLRHNPPEQRSGVIVVSPADFMKRLQVDKE